MSLTAPTSLMMSPDYLTDQPLSRSTYKSQELGVHRSFDDDKYFEVRFVDGNRSSVFAGVRASWDISGFPQHENWGYHVWATDFKPP